MLWAGSLVSNVGSWMQTVAVGALVTADTGKAAWAVAVAAGAFLPIGVLSPIGGALADRINRRAFLIAANLVEAALAAIIAVLVYSGHTSPGLLTLVVSGQGCVSALVSPFDAAILPDLVPRDEFLAAAGLNATQWNMGRVVGPLAAGLTVAAFGYGTAFVVNAASFLAVVIAVLFVPLARPAPSGAASLWHRMKAGAQTAAADPGCRSAISLMGIVALLASPFIALVPAVARALSNGSPGAVASATAALTTGQGVGAVLGALLITPLAARWGRGRTLTAELMALCVALVAYDLAPSLATAVAMLTVVGAIYIGVLSGMQTVVQLRAPDEFRGRVLSIYLVALGVLYPIGSIVQGPLADALGLRAVTVTSAVLLLCVLAGLRVARPRIFEALGEDVLPATS